MLSILLQESDHEINFRSMAAYKCYWGLNLTLHKAMFKLIIQSVWVVMSLYLLPAFEDC